MLVLNTVLQDRYRIIRLMNQGNMGAVYLAEDTRLGNNVALKETFFSSNDAELREQFHREARLLSRLRHASLPRVIDHFIEGSGQFLVMDFIAGKDLMELLEENGGPLPVNMVLEWADQLLDVLIYLHGQDEPVIHRDIKPANIKLTPQGRVILLDFGLAKGATGSMLMSLPAATLAYAPIEQVLVQGTDSRSDLFSLGATLFHLLTNTVPTLAVKRKDALWKGFPDPLPPASDIVAQVPEALAIVLTEAMALAADDRPQTAAEMRALLRNSNAAFSAKGSDTPVVSSVDDAKPDSYKTTLPFRAGQLPVERKVVTGPDAPVAPPRKLPQPTPATPADMANEKRSYQDDEPRIAAHPRKQYWRYWLAAVVILIALTALGVWIVGSSKSVVPVTDLAAEVTKPAKQLDPQTYTETVGTASIEMVRVPGATFTMGSPKEEQGSFDDERPQHEVTISPFHIGKYEVTQAQWLAVVTTLPKVKIDLNASPSNFKGDSLPVEQVSWEDAVEFCDRISQATGKSYRLPTEAEWEYACRAGTQTPFAFGETITPKIVNYDGNYPYGKAAKGEYRKETVAAGSLGVANGFGLYDMHGNVWEWCQDWAGPYPSGSATNPQGPSQGSSRRVRGGSWVSNGVICRSACRFNVVPGNRNSNIGFRVVVVSRTP